MTSESTRLVEGAASYPVTDDASDLDGVVPYSGQVSYSAPTTTTYGSLVNTRSIPGDGKMQNCNHIPNKNLGHISKGEEDILPMLYRSKTFSDTAKCSSNISIPFSVNNPQNFERRLSVFPGNDYDELYRRVDSLKLMRPFKLIGHVSRLINWKNYKISEGKMKKIKNSELKKYYRNQNDMIDRYQDIDMLLDTGIQIEMIQNYADNTSTDTSSDTSHSEEEEEEEEGETGLVISKSKKMRKHNSNISRESGGHRHVNTNATPGNIDLEGAKILGSGEDATSSNMIMYAIYFNFFLNVILLIGKLIVVYLSDSLSLMASLVDSALDFLSTLIIFFANKYAMKQSTKFPIGRKQLEPIGVLIFSIIIIISFAQVLIESIKQLTNPDISGEVVQLSNVAVAIMVGTIITKLLAYILCKNVDNSSVRALVEDAKTDVVFNFFSLIFPTIGVILNLWWIDAFGASLLCCYVIIQWGLITVEHVDHLSGSHASKEDYQQVLYLIMRFTDEVAKVKNYRMYHMGDLVNVEVDIVLRNSKMSLKDCHDLGESLQYAIETLPYVSRCFVHIDYKVRNYMGHLTG